MAFGTTASIAFDRPGGGPCRPSRRPPVDLAHLARQSLGDRQVEAEVLSLFLGQTATVAQRLAAAGAAERRALAHGLVGSARAIGAFAIADCAAAIEARPQDASALRRLPRLIDDVREFVASISR